MWNIWKQNRLWMSLSIALWSPSASIMTLSCPVSPWYKSGSTIHTHSRPLLSPASSLPPLIILIILAFRISHTYFNYRHNYLPTYQHIYTLSKTLNYFFSPKATQDDRMVLSLTVSLSDHQVSTRMSSKLSYVSLFMIY